MLDDIDMKLAAETAKEQLDDKERIRRLEAGIEELHDSIKKRNYQNLIDAGVIQGLSRIRDKIKGGE